MVDWRHSNPFSGNGICYHRGTAPLSMASHPVFSVQAVSETQKANAGDDDESGGKSGRQVYVKRCKVLDLAGVESGLGVSVASHTHVSYRSLA